MPIGLAIVAHEMPYRLPCFPVRLRSGHHFLLVRLELPSGVVDVAKPRPSSEPIGGNSAWPGAALLVLCGHTALIHKPSALAAPAQVVYENTASSPRLNA